MITYANQKVVTVRKAKSDKDNPYTIINKECAMSAAKELDAGAYKLWIFFELQADNYTFALSSKFLNDEFGMGRKQYNAAVATLIEHGYLSREEGNGYVFDETGKEPCTKTVQALYQKDTSLVPKGNKGLYQNGTRKITKNTRDYIENTMDDVFKVSEITNLSSSANTSVFANGQDFVY